VGCIVTLAVAAAGAVGGALTGIVVGLEIQALFEVNLTKRVCEKPAVTPANVTED